MNEPRSSPRRELIEILAALEHEQWLHWSQAVSSQVAPELRSQWQRSWVAYDKLTDGQKEADRVWARKVVALLRQRRLIR